MRQTRQTTVRGVRPTGGYLLIARFPASSNKTGRVLWRSWSRDVRRGERRIRQAIVPTEPYLRRPVVFPEPRFLGLDQKLYRPAEFTIRLVFDLDAKRIKARPEIQV